MRKEVGTDKIVRVSLESYTLAKEIFYVHRVEGGVKGAFHLITEFLQSEEGREALKDWADKKN